MGIVAGCQVRYDVSARSTCEIGGEEGEMVAAEMLRDGGKQSDIARDLGG